MTYDLNESALWLIIDPWVGVYNQGSVICPNIDEINAPTIKKIAGFVSGCKHVLVSCPIYEDKQKIKIADELKDLPNINNYFEL